VYARWIVLILSETYNALSIPPSINTHSMCFSLTPPFIVCSRVAEGVARVLVLSTLPDAPPSTSVSSFLHDLHFISCGAIEMHTLGHASGIILQRVLAGI